jgi:UDP-glucose 4-epimerase
MDSKNNTVLVTGGAGFIGSHLIDALIERDFRIVCVDDLSLGTEENIRHHFSNPDFLFRKLDILNKTEFEKIFGKNNFGCVFHLAANSDIRAGSKYLDLDLKKNFETTFNILNCMKEHNVGQIVFASTSAIYGEHHKVLSEETGPLFPISYYGASKLCAEAYISAFCHHFGFDSWIYRFPNVVGERLTHGVIFDFMNKLKNNPRELEILGNGKQRKPYLHVTELVEAMLYGWQRSKERINCFNLGVDSSTSVTRIAEIVAREMGLHNVSFKYTGGDKGWMGDVPRFQYDLSKIHKLGWQAKMSSDEAVELTCKSVLKKA